VPHFGQIDSMTVYDITALYQWRDLGIAASVFNLTDEDPPDIGTNLNYDANTHSSLGRMVKLQLTYSLGGK
jgi:outer membrane receptor protein involved in Fe transport